jgi:hypothetical protein
MNKAFKVRVTSGSGNQEEHVDTTDWSSWAEKRPNVMQAFEVKEVGDLAKGLFLRKDYRKIKKGEAVIECVGERISEKENKDRVTRYAAANWFNYMVPVKSMYIDNTVKGNWSRYMNHSCDPNCQIDPPVNVKGFWVVMIVAIRDIKPGEELSLNYGSDYRSWEGKFLPCKCSAPAFCSGILGIPKQNLLRDMNDLQDRVDRPQADAETQTDAPDNHSNDQQSDTSDGMDDDDVIFVSSSKGINIKQESAATMVNCDPGIEPPLLTITDSDGHDPSSGRASVSSGTGNPVPSVSQSSQTDLTGNVISRLMEECKQLKKRLFESMTLSVEISKMLAVPESDADPSKRQRLDDDASGGSGNQPGTSSSS